MVELAVGAVVVVVCAGVAELMAPLMMPVPPTPEEGSVATVEGAVVVVGVETVDVPVLVLDVAPDADGVWLYGLSPTDCVVVIAMVKPQTKMAPCARRTEPRRIVGQNKAL